MSKVQSSEVKEEERKAFLAAVKSFGADVDRAKCISIISEKVLREMCKSCWQADECEKNFGLSRLTCRMTAVAAVAVGMIGEKQEGGAR